MADIGTTGFITSALGVCISSLHHRDPHLLPLDVQTKQGHKAADLQQEVNKDSQAGKERERPHGWHVGQSSCAETETQVG